MNSEISLYERLGGEAPLKQLVDDFYHFMDSLPEASDIRKQHASDLCEANQKLFMFLSGWTGGPPLYESKFGHPRLRARHLPFRIRILERDQWLLCMWKALEQQSFDIEAVKTFKSAVFRL